MHWGLGRNRCIGLATPLKSHGEEPRGFHFLDELAKIARADIAALWHTDRLLYDHEVAVHHPHVGIGLRKLKERLLHPGPMLRAYRLTKNSIAAGEVGARTIWARFSVRVR
jgi:hypothetical protein